MFPVEAYAPAVCSLFSRSSARTTPHLLQRAILWLFHSDASESAVRATERQKAYHANSVIGADGLYLHGSAQNIEKRRRVVGQESQPQCGSGFQQDISGRLRFVYCAYEVDAHLGGGSALAFALLV